MKPAVVAGRKDIRVVMNLTQSFDDDLIDGAPAALCRPVKRPD